jgi:hypothetical protein
VTAGPSFCWWCLGDLHSDGNGLIYARVEDPIGNVHRVHHACVCFACTDGNQVLDGAQPVIHPSQYTRVRSRTPRRGNNQLARFFDADDGDRYAIHYVDGDARANE